MAGSRVPPRPSQRGGVKLIFELTNLCNFSCVHCIREEGGAKSFLPVDLVDKVLREAEPFQMVDNVAFTGGEPTIHPQFADLVGVVADRGYVFSFVTNGSRFERALAAILPVRNYVRAVNFSLDGAREGTHDQIRRRPGSFRQVVQAIATCRHHRLPVQLNMTVTRTNRGEVEEMALLAGRLGVAALGVAHCQPTPTGLRAGLVLDAAERLALEADVAELQRALTMPVFLAGDHWEPSPFHQCLQLQMRELNVDYRGFLTACCTLSNYRGGAADTDVVADLGTVSFAEGLKALVETVARVNLGRVDRIGAGRTTRADHFMCTYCLKHYRKVPTVEQILLREETEKAAGE
jgi:MoaA/NifB/PqqE/SkfB family radical SAM enzyme